MYPSSWCVMRMFSSAEKHISIRLSLWSAQRAHRISSLIKINLDHPNELLTKLVGCMTKSETFRFWKNIPDIILDEYITKCTINETWRLVAKGSKISREIFNFHSPSLSFREKLSWHLRKKVIFSLSIVNENPVSLIFSITCPRSLAVASHAITFVNNRLSQL